MATRISINKPRETVAGDFVITRRSTPIEHTFDEAELGRDVAQAILEAIAEGIAAITQTVAPATLKYREKARRALERGAAWAVARYEGRSPASSDRLFNDSGELAGELGLRQEGDTFQVTAPANRFDPPGGSQQSMVERLRDLVPALSNPFDDPRVRAAIERSWSKIFGR